MGSRISQSRGGFTLVEVMVALFIVMVGIMSGYGLINQTIVASNAASMKMTAAYLAKEGLEIVKNIRDSNYVYNNNHGGGVAWNNGLVSCLGGCKAQYDSFALSSATPGQSLKYDSSSGFNYSTGSVTAYNRIITVDASVAGQLSVIVVVGWSEHGNSHSLTAQENLYNWW